MTSCLTDMGGLVENLYFVSCQPCCTLIIMSSEGQETEMRGPTPKNFLSTSYSVCCLDFAPVMIPSFKMMQDTDCRRQLSHMPFYEQKTLQKMLLQVFMKITENQLFKSKGGKIIKAFQRGPATLPSRQTITKPWQIWKNYASYLCSSQATLVFPVPPFSNTPQKGQAVPFLAFVVL